MALQVDDVGISFDGSGGTTLKVLDQVGFSVDYGSFNTLVGPSGCGKSTLLQIMAGLITATEGAVRLDGRRYDAPPREIIYLFQQYTRSLLPWLTVRENVSFGLRMQGALGRKDIDDRCRDLIRIVGLEGFESYFPRQISGGMQQRVAIARALACQPKVILMDEPFSSVDALTRSSLQDELLRLWTELDLTVVFVTHDIEEAIYLGQRVRVLGGRPARIIKDIAVDLPAGRNQLDTHEHPHFLRYRHDLLTAIYENPSAAPDDQAA